MEWLQAGGVHNRCSRVISIAITNLAADYYLYPSRLVLYLPGAPWGATTEERMAFSELQERKLDLIEQRLGEHERSQSAIDWSVWTPRVVGAAAFALLMLAVILSPYQDLQPTRVAGQAMLVVGFVALYGFYLSRFRPSCFMNGASRCSMPAAS